MADKQIRLGIDASSAQQGADEWTRTTDQIRAKARLTAEGIRDLERSLGVTAQSFGRSGAQVSTTAKNALGSLFQYNQQIAASLKQTGDSATKVGASILASLQRAGSSVISTGGNIRVGVGQLSGELLGAAGNAEGMAGALGLSAAAIGPITALGAAVAGLGYGLVNGAKNALALERSLTLIASRTDPAQFGAYEDAALQLSKTLGVDNVQAAHAFTSALVSGFRTFDEQREAATIGLKLFKTEGVDAATAVALLDNVLDSYGRSADRAASTTNELLAAAKIGETTFQDMAQAVGIVGPVASNLGVDLEEVSGLIAGIAPKVGGATPAAQGFANLLLQLSDRTSAVNQELRKNGIEIDANAIRTRGFDAVLADVAKGLEGKESLLAQVFGSPRIAKVALSALQDAGAKSAEVIDQIRNSVDELNVSLERVELLPTSRIDKAESAVGGFFTQLGQSIKQGLSDVPGLLENGIFDDKLPTKTEQAYKLFELRFKETVGLVKEGSLASYVRDLGLAQAALDQKTKTTTEDLKAQAKVARLLKEGLVPWKDVNVGSPDFVGPPAPPPPFVPSTGPYPSPIGPEFDKSFASAKEAADALSASLETKIGTALEQEIAKVRESEEEIRKKIASYNDLGINTEKLTAQLFALTNQDDALIDTMKKSAAQAESDAASAQKIADARMRQAVATKQLGEASLLALVGARQLAQVLAEQAKQNSAFDQGPGQMLRDIQFQNDLIGQTSDATERLTALRQFDADAARLQAEAQRQGGDGFDFISGRIAATRQELERLLADRALKQKADQLGHAIADPLTDGLGAVLTRTKSFGDALVDVYRDIVANILKQSVLGPANQGLSGFFSKLLGGFGGGGGGGGGGGSGGTWDFGSEWARGGVFQNGSPIAFADGGMPWGSSLVPFARGDIVSRATRFPMSRGRTGVMGEAGTEAIMPVARGPSGRLGVQVVGGSRGSSEPSVANVDNSRSYTTTILLNKADDRRSVRQAMDDQRRLYAST